MAIGTVHLRARGSLLAVVNSEILLLDSRRESITIAPFASQITDRVLGVRPTVQYLPLELN